MNIFVGNLSFDAKESDVRTAFAVFGKVENVVIVKEKKGQKSRGFGFVLMPDELEAKTAIDALNGKEILGRAVNVMPSVPKRPLKITGKYREGRRTIKYIKKRRELGLSTPAFEPKYKPNPMAWPKKKKFEKKGNFPGKFSKEKAGSKTSPYVPKYHKRGIKNNPTAKPRRQFRSPSKPK